MSIDAVMAAAAYLRADVTVQAALGDPDLVATEELHAGLTPGMPARRVVIQSAGGPGEAGTLHLDRQRIDAKSYGTDPFDARRLARIVHDAFKRLRRVVVRYVDEEHQAVGVLLHSATDSGAMVNTRDPDTEWPLAMRSYVLLVAEEAVA